MSILSITHYGSGIHARRNDNEHMALVALCLTDDDRTIEANLSLTVHEVRKLIGEMSEILADIEARPWSKVEG
jgi:hypothetical protein